MENLTKESSECQWNTIQTAEAVHRLSPPILVYVIGVTDNINKQELETIATNKNDVTYLDSFNSYISQEAQEKHSDEVCDKGITHARHASHVVALVWFLCYT